MSLHADRREVRVNLGNAPAGVGHWPSLIPRRRSATADEKRNVQLVRQAVGMGRRAYVLVNNRAEGNAPLTVQRLVGMLLK